VPEAGHPGTPRLHEGVFENGRGIFKLATYRDPAEVIDDEYPVWLTTGRRLESYHTHTQTGRTEGIEYLLPSEVLEIHPDDVARLGLENGAAARVSSRRGSVDVTVQANTRSPRGTVFMSFAFADVPVNVLTGGGYDPVTQTPELKVCPVRVEAIVRG
jgi:formate dehydrogenase major subunit